jgi:hypothetical protein
LFKFGQDEEEEEEEEEEEDKHVGFPAGFLVPKGDRKWRYLLACRN